MDSIVLLQQPESIEQMGINYNSLYYFNAQVTLAFNCDKFLFNKEPFKLNMIDKYIILKKLERNDWVIRWIVINHWNIQFEVATKRKTPEELTMKMITEDNNYEMTLVFKFQSDFEDFFFRAKQICTITYPPLEKVYTYKKAIGRGSQATIDLYLLQKEDKIKQYAVKTYHFNHEKPDEYNSVKNEISFLRELIICDNFIHLDSVYANKDQIQCVMKFAQYGSLKDYVKFKEREITENQIRTAMEQLLLAVDLMHRKKIIHRDLKPDNILITDEESLQVVIADLGMACSSTDSKALKQKCGTPNFVDPDVLKGFPFQFKSDIFSLGSVLFTLITGKYLFSGDGIKDVIMKNKFNDPLPVIEAACQLVSPECRDLLKLMLSRNTTKRPTAEECLKHEWFKVDRQTLENMLTINKNPSIAISLGSRNSFNSSVNDTSLILGPNYFQNISPDEESKSPMNQLLVPFSNMFRSRTPVLKFSYNRRHSMQGNEQDKDKGANGFSESILSNQKHIKKFNKTSNAIGGLIDKSVEHCALIQIEKANDEEKKNSYNDDDESVSGVFSSDNEYINSLEDIIETKVVKRKYIDEMIMIPQRQLSLKNPRTHFLFTH